MYKSCPVHDDERYSKMRVQPLGILVYSNTGRIDDIKKAQSVINLLAKHKE